MVYKWNQIPKEIEHSALGRKALAYICDLAQTSHPEYKKAFDALLADINAWLENQRQ